MRFGLLRKRRSCANPRGDGMVVSVVLGGAREMTCSLASIAKH